MHCKWIVIAGLLFTTALFSAAADRSYDPSPFGINGIKYEWACRLPNGWSHARKSARVMKEAGIYWDRDPVPWNVVQPQKDEWDWSCPDAVARFNREQGINSIIVLTGCSAWSDNTPPRTDEERAAFAEYVYRMVSRYKDTFKVWEIWNEPNIPFFWPEPNVEHYTLLLKEAYKAAKRADPTCTVLAPNTSGPDLTFIRGICERGGWDYFDGLCTHPYSMAGGPIPQRFDRICRMINEFVKGTGKPKSVWITEIGWTAQKPEEEREQAIFLFQCYVIALANGVEKICWFDLDDWEEKWGIIRRTDPFRPKLAYGTYRLMTRYLGSPGEPARFEGWLPMPDGVVCYVFRRHGKGDEFVLALWSNDDRPRTVVLGQRDGLRAVDAFGNPVTISRPSGSWRSAESAGCSELQVGPVPIIVSGFDHLTGLRTARGRNPYAERKGQNLLNNGSLEILWGDRPAWWNPGRFDGTAKDGTFAVCDGGRGGGRCVSISSSGDRFAYDAVPAPVYPGRRYRLTAWVRTQDATGSNQIGLFWYKGNMWTYVREDRSESITGTCAWTRVTVTATAPRDAMFVRANLISEKNTGTVWFDDTALVEE